MESDIDISQLKKFEPQLAAPLLAKYAQDNAANNNLVTETTTSVEYLKLLVQKGLYPDAIRFLAHGLPKREAVWWAYIAAAKYETNLADSLVVELLDKTKKWVYSPVEENRIALQPLAEKLGFSRAASWAAIAAFWSEGNITPQEKAQVFASPTLSPAAITGAILLSAVSYQPEKAIENYYYFLKQGVHIANNGNGEI